MRGRAALALTRLRPLVLVALLTRLAPIGCATAPEAPPVVAPPPPVATSAPPPAPPPPPAPIPRVQVHGRLLGNDGAPMKLAHIHHGTQTVAVDATGAFSLELDAGFQEIRATGVDHAARVFGLYLDGTSVAVDLQLGTYDRGGPLDRVAVVWSHREGEGTADLVGARLVTRAPRDGFVAELTPIKRAGKASAPWPPAGQLLYQLRGVAKDHIVNGPEAQGFLYDGDGDYFSIPIAPGLKVRVDPARLPPANAAPRVTFADPATRAARIGALHLAAMRRLERPSDDTGAADVRAAIVQALAIETDPDVLAALRLAYLTPAPPPSEEASRVADGLIAKLPAKSSLWRFHPEAALDAFDLAHHAETTVAPRETRETFLKDVLEGIEDAGAASRFLLDRVHRAARAGHDEELAAVYAVLQARFAQTPAGRSAASYDPARRVRPSHELPDLDLAAFGGPGGERVTRASLRGKVVLIDFWGTWCPPCIAEVKNLDAAYAKHKGEGLVIVSIAAHDTAARVRRFRASSPMPWKHVVLDKATEDEILERFEVHSFPSEILVDREGHVVRVGDELRGDALEPAIRAALAP